MPSDCANCALVSGVSTLAAKYSTLKRRNWSPLVPSDRHSAVQPPVKAFGNHAITTARPRPRISLNRCTRPSDPGSSKAGARSPGFNSTSPRPAVPATIVMAPAVVAAADAVNMRRSFSRRTGSRAVPDHVILVNAMDLLRHSHCTFSIMTCRSPNSRIGVQILGLMFVLTTFAACNKTSPTSPSGPPAAGSAIVYTALGASDATGHGSSVECDVPFQE